MSRVGLLDSDPPTGVILAAASAATEAIWDATGGEVGEFDIQSLSEALGFERRSAILVARLCGAYPFTNGQKTIWRNADSAPLIRFEGNMLEEYVANNDW